MKKIKYYVLIVFFVFGIMFDGCTAVFAENPNSQGSNDDLTLNALSAVLIDADTGRILYGKNPNEKRAMASTTKIMTCIITLENGNLNDEVVISKRAVSMPKVRYGFSVGQKYTLNDLCYSLMLESHNDTAVAIAEHVGGSVEGFAAMMNKKAAELGMKNTNFVTPNGLDAKEHYSTAYDMALLGAYAIKNEEFVKIVNTKSHTVRETGGASVKEVYNKDAFLGMMDGALGIKTGFTGMAGYCFVGAVKKGDHNFVSSVLGSGWPPNKSYKWNDTLSLMKYGMVNFEMKEIIKKQPKYRTVGVNNGQEKTVTLCVDDEIKMLLGRHEKMEIVENVPDVLKAPVNKGDKVGSIEIVINNKKIRSIPVRAVKSIEKTDFEYYLTMIIKEFLIAV